MKNIKSNQTSILYVFFIAFIIFLSSSCSKDEVDTSEKEGLVQLSFSSMDKESLKNSLGTEMEAPCFIFISVEDEKGSSIHYLKKLELIKFNEKYMTKPIALHAGNYNLTDFLVADKNGNVLYAAPKSSSIYSNYVNVPLSIDFTVETDKTVLLCPQVLTVNENLPESFGYLTFTFDIIKSRQFLISVFIFDESNMIEKLSTADIQISVGDKLVYNNSLDSVTNIINLPVSDSGYTLKVNKNGYEKFTKTFTYDEINAYCLPEGEPFVVLLKKMENRLIFWNKLGSIEELANSEVGPPVIQTTYLIDEWEEAYLAPAIFGNGLYVNHDISEGWNNNGGNFFSIDIEETGLQTNKGCIEFWFVFKYDCSTYNHAYFYNFADERADHFTSRAISGNYIDLIWNGWDYGTSGKRFGCFMGVSGQNPSGGLTGDYTTVPGGKWEFNTDDKMHFAVSWDSEGIENTGETFRFYINGELALSSSTKIYTDYPFTKYLYIGTQPSIDPWDHYYNAVKGITDNLKMWNYAKTDFSDRFTE